MYYKVNNAGFSLLECLLSIGLSSLLLSFLLAQCVWTFKNVARQNQLTYALNEMYFLNFYLSQAILPAQIIAREPRSLQIKNKHNQETLFYVAKVVAKSVPSGGGYALFEKVGSHRRLALVKGITSMGVTYARDSIVIRVKGRGLFNWRLRLVGVQYAKT